MGKNSRPLPPPLTGKQGRGGATPAVPEAGGLGLDGASGGGEKREEEVGVRFPYLARAGVEWGRLSTEAGGDGQSYVRRRRWELGEGARSGGRGRGGGELRGKSI